MMNIQAEASSEQVDKETRVTKDTFVEPNIMVEIKVGADEKSFAMHKSVLCKVSPFFKAALDGHFAEAETNVLKLPEDDPDVFGYFTLWAYTNQLLEQGQTAGDIPDENLIGLYIFGDTRGIADLQNAVVDITIDKADIIDRIPTGYIPRIYKELSQNCPLRRLLVDFSANRGDLDSWYCDEDNPDLVRDFLKDLVVALFKIKEGIVSSINDFGKVRKDYYVKPLEPDSTS